MSTAAPHRALIVDRDARLATTLGVTVERAGYSVVCHSAFEQARGDLIARSAALLISNTRLAAFNGIHLAYLAKFVNPGVRIVIYAHPHDQVLAREAQAAGAFYERGELIPFSLPALLTSGFPASDRRESFAIDRRIVFRGGRRVTDVAPLHERSVE